MPISDTHVTPFELQQSIERYTGHFIDGATDALHDALQSESASVHRAALQRLLLYGSSALDIATGPIPEINVVDMAVFLALSRSAIESHWLPNVFGDDGRALLDAFARAEAELDEILDTVLSAAQKLELSELIANWLASNHGRVSVEWVRFQDFASRASEIEHARRNRARGLLGSVKSAAQTADQAMLLAERALFLSHRLPFLMRLQARVCVRESIMDAFSALRDGVLRRAFAYVVLVGATWALLFWFGYYIAHGVVAP